MKKLDIRNHLYYRLVDCVDDEEIEVLQMENLLKNRDVDQNIKKYLPIDKFDDVNEFLKIRGVKSVLERHNHIENEVKKMDITCAIEDVEYIGLNDKNEVILYFPKEDIQAIGMYNFTYDFFENVFGMGKFHKTCIENEVPELIMNNVNELSKKIKDKKYQFRLLNNNGQYYLRGLTSTRYNYYDNNIALYIALHSLHKFAKENNTKFVIEQPHISDSSLLIFFEQEEAISIPNVGDICFGILLTNSEIKESQLYYEIRYKIKDNNNNSFSALPNLNDSVFTIKHSLNIENIESRIENTEHLKEIQDSMLEYITNLKKFDTISEDIIYLLMTEITDARRKFKSKTRDNFEKLYDKNIINNSLTLIEAFDKINQITSDINERIYLERIYHKLITELVS